MAQSIFAACKVKHLPAKGPYFIVLVERSVSQRGPDSSPVEFFDTVIITTEDDLRSWISTQEFEPIRYPYKVFQVQPVGISKTITIEVQR